MKKNLFKAWTDQNGRAWTNKWTGPKKLRTMLIFLSYAASISPVHVSPFAVHFFCGVFFFWIVPQKTKIKYRYFLLQS